MLAVRLNVIFSLLTAAAIYALVHRWSDNRSLACGAATLFCVNEPMLLDSLGGMESFMFAALTLWALYFVVGGEGDVWAGLVSGLSILARPEGLLVAATCSAAWVIHSRQNIVRYAVALGLPVVCWLVFAEAYFGTVVSHSIVAKARPLYPLPPGDGLQMIDHITTWTFEDRLWSLRAVKPALALESRRLPSSRCSFLPRCARSRRGRPLCCLSSLSPFILWRIRRSSMRLAS